MHCKTQSFPLVVISLVLLLAAAAHPQVSGRSDSRSDVRLHKFQPAVRPEDAAARQLSGTATVEQQMQALQDEKAARTPAQTKIDSNLLYTMRMMAGRPAAPGVPYLNTGVELDQDNNLVVDITAQVSAGLLQQLRLMGAAILYTNAELHSIRARVPPDRLETIADSPEVIFVAPKQGFMTHHTVKPGISGRERLLLPMDFGSRAARLRNALPLLLQQAIAQTGQGSVTTEGDATHRAAVARGAFGISGAGLKIGVLSVGASSFAQSQATGDLPPTCGTPPCLTILPGQVGTEDEGTAMMEIIYDMAPGASLYFATAFNGVASFAQNIRALRAAGCDIIVDDVFYFHETPFQDGQANSVVSNTNAGAITQAVNDVVADGALYFSSAGNEGNLTDGTSGTYEGDFVPMPSSAPLPAGNVHNFGTAGYDTLNASSPFGYTLHWADPLGGSANDYDLYILDSTGSTVVAASTNIQNGTQDPVELITATVSAGSRIVVFQKNGAANRFFHLSTLRGVLSVSTPGETHGHSAASGAYTVAATSAAVVYPNVFNAGNVIEQFSSDGLRRIFFNADSSAITPGNFTSTGGRVLNKPDVTAADGVSVTGVGGFGSPFYGTSAAAPAAASVAALVKSAKPTLTPAEIRDALTSTTVDIMGPGFDRNSGAGIVMAYPAVNSLGVPGFADPELSQVFASELGGNGNHVIEPGETGSLQITLTNIFGVKDATGISAALSSSTPGVVIGQPNSTYDNIFAGNNGGNNLTPLLFTLTNDFTCGQAIDFILTLTFQGGPAPTRALRFRLETGILQLNSSLGTPTSAPGVSTATGTQPNRIFRDANPSVCGNPKQFPGTVNSGTRTFDSYTFTACRSMCMPVELNANINFFVSAYSPSYDPNHIATNYAGDAGFSADTETFSINTQANTQYTLVVNDVSGSSAGTGYNIKFPLCALSCNVPRLAFGWLDSARNAADSTSSVPQGGTLLVAGWAADQQDGAPISKVQVLIDDAVVGEATLGDARPDVAAALNNPAFTNSGWHFSYPVPGNLLPGTHTVRAVARNSIGSIASLSNLVNITITTANTPPFGWLDNARNAISGTGTVAPGGTLNVLGWAGDFQDGAPVFKVQVLLDGGVIGNAVLGDVRTDVAHIYGNNFTNSGWHFTYSVPNTIAFGTHQVTAVATDSANATAQLSNTISVTVGNTPPFGWVDSAHNPADGTTTVPQGRTVAIAGWAVDDQDGAPITKVQVLLDGTLIGNAVLGDSRPDVASALHNPLDASSGWHLNYTVPLATATGSHTVTAVGFDSSGASASLASSASFTVVNALPFGWLDNALNAANGTGSVAQGGTLSIVGWAVDVHDGAPVSKVQVFIDGSLIGNATLGDPRPDVASAFSNPAYTNSGWHLSYQVPNTLSVGQHTVTAVAFNSANASATIGGGATITVTQ